jgi:hypothetical protein
LNKESTNESQNLRTRFLDKSTHKQRSLAEQRLCDSESDSPPDPLQPQSQWQQGEQQQSQLLSSTLTIVSVDVLFILLIVDVGMIHESDAQ